LNTTIYIFGNLPVFQAALTGLQMIFNPANNTDWAVGGSLFGVGPVVGIGLLISLLHVTTKGVWTQKMSLHHVGIMLGLYAAMFIPTTSVQVQDIYTGQTVIVDQIPIGVAYPAAIVSQLSYDAATQLGQAFQMATATAPTTDISQGFAEPLQQMLQMRHLYQNYVKTDTPLADAEFSFFQQCVYPVYSSDTTLQAAYNETNNILATVTNTNYVTASGANMMVNVLGGTGNPICGSSQGCLLTCNGLASTLNTQYTQWKGSSGSGSCTAAVAMAAADKSDTVKPPSSCTTAASNLGNVLAQLGTTGDQYIDQMVHGCMASAGMSAGGSLFAGEPSMSVLPSYCVITQNSLSQAQVDNAGAASMFLKNMLPLMSVLQFLFIAMAPLAAFTMVMAGAQGMGMFVKYIMFGLWTQSWLPVAAMLNDYSQITLAHKLGVLGQAVTGVSANITAAATSVTLASMPPPPANGLTLTTLPTVIESTMQALSNADMLLALTPIITMIVFTGSYMGMAQLAQDMGGEDKVSQNTSEETPSLKTQEDMNGVHASENPSAPGKLVYGPGAMSETLSAGNAVSMASEAGQALTGSSTTNAATSWSNVAKASQAVNLSNGHTLSSTVMNSVAGSMDQSTAVGHMIKGMQSAGISADEQMAVIGGLSAVTRNAFQGAKAKGATDAEAEQEAEAAGKGFLNAIGGGLGKALEGVKIGLDTRMTSALSSKQGRDELWDAGHKITSSLKQASQNSFGSTHVSGDTAQLGSAIDNAEKSDAAVQTAVAQSDSMRQSASRIAQAGGNTQMNPVQLEQAYASRPGGFGAMHNDLMKLYGGDTARMQSDLNNMGKLEKDPKIAMARLMIRGIDGNTAGLTPENRYAAMSSVFQNFDGSSISTGQDASNFGQNTASQIAARQGQVGAAVGQTRATVQPGADKARAQAETAPGRVNGDPVTPPSGVSGNLSGSQVGAYGAAGAQGEGSALYQSGARQVAAHTGDVPTPAKAKAMIDQAAANTSSVLMKPVEWANRHPELTALGIGVFNFLSGAIGAGGAAAAGAAAKKLLSKLGGGGEPPASGGVAGEPLTPGGDAGEVPRAPGGALPEGSPRPGLPGGSSGSPALGGPPEAAPPGGGQWVDVLDKGGNVVGRTSVTAAEAAMPERALGEILASRAAQFGGAALRIGGAVLDMAAVPLMAGQLATYSPEVGAATLPQMDQRQDTVKQLMLNDPKFAQQGTQLKQMADSGKGATPQFQALQQQVNARIDQAMANPASIPKAAPPSNDDGPPVVPGV
jgi:conjugal transfer mating pair stabilization protein TraG